MLNYIAHCSRSFAQLLCNWLAHTPKRVLKRPTTSCVPPPYRSDQARHRLLAASHSDARKTMAAKAAATTLEQKLKSLVDAVDADAASQVYAGAFGGLSLGESVKQGPAPPSSWSEGDGVKTATAVYAGAA